MRFLQGGGAWLVRAATSVVLTFLAGGVAFAQHESHNAAGQQPAQQQNVAACAQAQLTIGRALDAATVRLEAARQANNAAAMRAAVDDLQGVLRDVRAQLEPCAAMQAGADPHAGHSMGAAAPAMPAEAVDPVCGMKVDPKTAPTAMHAGETYYFCSAGDRDIFLKAPEKYIKK